MNENNNTLKKYSLYALLAMLAITATLWFYVSVWQKSALKTHAEISKTALLNCFEKGAVKKKKDKEKPLICEASGVTYLANQAQVIIVHDKSVPDQFGSSIFKTAYQKENETLDNKVQYLKNNAINHAKKYEDITLTADKHYVIATTAFDRVKKGETGWDNYNSLVYWPVNKPDSAKVVSPAKTNNSVHLREKFAQVLGLTDPYYFKIEGLTALNNNRLLFGIREFGKSYKDFSYTFKVISVSYTINAGQLQLKDDFKQHDLNINQTNNTMGLSGLEYDADKELLYILGSYEKKTADGEKQLGGALWMLTLAEFNNHQPAQQVLLKDNTPLSFSHKAEGITVLDAERLLIIYDDDKELVVGNHTRQPHQTAYSIIQLLY